MFVPGDLIKQRHQVGAQPRLVVATTADSDIVVVFNDSEDRFHRVISSGYDLVSPATDVTRAQAVDMSLSEAYSRTTMKPHW
jgi:hypothetical protein